VFGPTATQDPVIGNCAEELGVTQLAMQSLQVTNANAEFASSYGMHAHLVAMLIALLYAIFLE
jgi:hypothetical protein